MLDPQSVWAIVRDGGPDVIFLLLVVLGLVLAGQLRVKANVDTESAAIERAHPS